MTRFALQKARVRGVCQNYHTQNNFEKISPNWYFLGSPTLQGWDGMVSEDYLTESVYLVIGEVQSGEVVDPREDHHLDNLQLVIAQVQLHQAGPPVWGEAWVGQSLHFVVTERRIEIEIVSNQ